MFLRIATGIGIAWVWHSADYYADGYCGESNPRPCSHNPTILHTPLHDNNHDCQIQMNNASVNQKGQELLCYMQHSCYILHDSQSL